MKIKKILVLVSMLAVMFSLSACGETYDKPFAYDENEMVANAMMTFVQYENISDEYVDYYLTAGTEFEKSAVKGIVQTQETDNVGEYEDFYNTALSVKNNIMTIKEAGARIENGPDYITVYLTNNAENRDVEISIKYYENAEYFVQYNKIVSASGLETYETFYQDISYFASQYGEEALYQALASYGVSTPEELYQMELNSVVADLNSQGLYPYIEEEMVVSAIYSRKELIGQAGMNTLIGMGTVFIVLIFISFIISLFKFLPALFAKKPKVQIEKKAEPVKTTSVSETTKTENLINDAELVAVITAAIYAATGQSGSCATSKDKLVVRSIKKVRK